MVYTYNYSAFKRKFCKTCYNMDEPRKHYANWNKPDTKGQICEIPLYEVLKITEFIKTGNRKVIIKD